jgi:hypothetical protein
MRLGTLVKGTALDLVVWRYWCQIWTSLHCHCFVRVAANVELLSIWLAESIYSPHYEWHLDGKPPILASSF